MEYSFDVEAYRAREAEARRIWESGGTTKAVAAALDLSIESARKHQKRWARTAVKDSVPRAIDVLLANGFGPDVVAILLNISPQEVGRRKNKSEALTRAASVARLGPISMAVSDLELSPRADNTLKRLGVSTVSKLCKLTEPQLRATKGCGETTVNEIVGVLGKLGLSLSS